MVVRVAKQMDALVRAGIRVVVVCDSPAILEACREHDTEAILTRVDHVSGTDRLAQACEILALEDDALVVNVQGDEPLIQPTLVSEVAKILQADSTAHMSTAAHPVHSCADLTNPNIVKVVLNGKGHAQYFSRAPIPWWRDGNVSGIHSLPAECPPLRHIGIYGYRVGFLRQFPSLAPSPLEHVEALEQLRALWNGFSISVHVTSSAPGLGVDTPEDLDRVRKIVDAESRRLQ